MLKLCMVASENRGLSGLAAMLKVRIQKVRSSVVHQATGHPDGRFLRFYSGSSDDCLLLLFTSERRGQKALMWFCV
jgi:hypothetical protein